MLNFIKKEAVLCISTVLAVISAIFIPPSLEYISYINFKVLALLFSLMAIVAGLRELKIFDIIAEKLAVKCTNTRSLVFVLTSLCFFSSMLITNDVALLTFVPLAISVLTLSGNEKHIIYTVILQTIAANMGSMMTPMGNPQNLYLSDFYSMTATEFFGTVAPLCILSGILIVIMHLPIKKEPVSVSRKTEFKSPNKKLTALYIALGILSLFAVFNVTKNLYIILTIVTTISLLVFDRKIFKRIDWFLLLTFVMFFIFVGNAAKIDFVQAFASRLTVGREMLAGAITSQFISNVPAAVMLSTFTDNGKALLKGVDIGGLGTPIASLASLISYRIYCGYKNNNKGKYMICFLIVNFALLVILLLFGNLF